MKIYVDFVLFLNFCFDFILLFGTSYVLKRKIDLNRLIISSFIGSFTVLFLFFNISSLFLFFLKFFIALLMMLVAFKFDNFLYFVKNIITFYILGFFLGGILYALNLEFSTKTNGFIFFNSGFSINVVFLLLLSPIVVFLYIKYLKNLRSNNLSYYDISFVFNNNDYKLVGFLDTGCKLRDPYGNRPIILVGKDILNFEFNNYVLVPYTTIDSKGMIKCVKLNRVFVNGCFCRRNILLGFLDTCIGIDGVDCIIQSSLLEGYNA